MHLSIKLVQHSQKQHCIKPCLPANDTITIADHRFVDGDRLNYRDGGGTALVIRQTKENTLCQQHRTNDTFKLSATSGGSAIDLTGVGVGTAHVFQTDAENKI